MIPASYFVHVIQVERERDLERRQRTHGARSAARPRSSGGAKARIRAALDAQRRLARPALATAACDDRATSAACY